MLVIRAEQICAFESAARGRLEDDAADRLRLHWTSKCESMGTAALYDAVRDGIERATSYGVDFRSGIFRFLNVIFLLGPDFDRGEQGQWARQILSDEALAPALKIDLLVRNAKLVYQASRE